MVMATPDLDTLNEQQLRDLARQLLADTQAQITHKDRLLNLKDTTIAQLTHEIAVLRRFRFGKKSEQINGVQGSLLEEAVAADIAAIEEAGTGQPTILRRSHLANNQNAKPCRRSCPASRFTMNHTVRHAPVAASLSASGKTWPKSSTTSRGWLALSAISGANGRVARARRSPRPRHLHM